MAAPIHRSRQPGGSLAQKPPPRIIEREPIPAAFRPRKPAPFHMNLAEVLSDADVKQMTDAGRMAFHCIGDTGGVKRPEAQQLVARGMEQSLKSDKMSPRFCYNVGDLVYYNGEVNDYWDQFYEPYEHYPLPIVAIPGNHDGELLTRQSIDVAPGILREPGRREAGNLHPRVSRQRTSRDASAVVLLDAAHPIRDLHRSLYQCAGPWLAE
jgi:hypothetical protein